MYNYRRNVRKPIVNMKKETLFKCNTNFKKSCTMGKKAINYFGNQPFTFSTNLLLIFKCGKIKELFQNYQSTR